MLDKEQQRRACGTNCGVGSEGAVQITRGMPSAQGIDRQSAEFMSSHELMLGASAFGAFGWRPNDTPSD